MTSISIAYISFEYPPDTSGGGIGTYVQQVARLMHSHGHSVTVFCGTSQDNYTVDEAGIKVYKIKSTDTESFRSAVVETFSRVYNTDRFDIIEGPEYGADGYEIKRKFPLLPYVVKCHSATFVIKEYNDFFRQYILASQKIASAKIWLKKFFRRPYYPFYNKEKDIEYINIKLADQIFSPSGGLAKKLMKEWKITPGTIAIVPNPYYPSVDLLSIPLTYENKRITFIGKLSVLKGMVDVIAAIPLVAKENAQLKFRFIGQDAYAQDGRAMSEVLIEKCSNCKGNIELLGKVALSDIPKYLNETDIVLCTSLWENYPTVILEAFSAGRCVIATNTGGIPEIVQHEKNGILVEPKSPENIAAEILRCYSNKQLMHQCGSNGRKFIQTDVAGADLYTLIIDNYLQTIKKCTKS